MRKIYALWALALVAGCGDGADRAKEEERQVAAVEAAAEGKAEQGRFSIKGPGFDLKIDMPEGMANQSEGDNVLLYPGAKLSGMHVEAAEGAGKGAASGVELRFTSSDAPAKVSQWYRDPARKNGFSVSSEARDGEAILIKGTQQDGGEPFTLRLLPGAEGGTQGRLTLSEKG